MASFNNVEWKMVLPENHTKDDLTIGIEFEGNLSRLHSRLTNSCSDYEKGVNRFIKNHPIIGGVGLDGGGIETVTQPFSELYLEEDGPEELQKYMRYLKREMKPLETAGTHIHVGLPSNMNPNFNFNLYWIIAYFGTEFQKIFGRKSNWACIPSNKIKQSINNNGASIMGNPYAGGPIINKVKARDMYIVGGYDFSSATYEKSSCLVRHRNTIEFRFGKSTNDLNEVLAWCEVARNTMKLSNQDNVAEIKLSDILEGKHISKYIQKINKNKDRRISNKELNTPIKKIRYINTSSTENKIF